MTPDDIKKVQTSFALAMAKKTEVTRTFYDTLFALAPYVRPLFPTELHRQRDKLIHALAFCVKNLTEPESLLPVVEDLARKHVRYGAEPDHYAVVGVALMTTLKDTLGPALTPEVAGAWARTYDYLSSTMIAAAESYAEDHAKVKASAR